ncbi:epoxide hydrolase [Actinorhabdospora filicis]|uniref:Epoxide hydrolase n=1 Tax=Actinorhabdospora filicis TaxID=1785913 RepID=A0A9W6SMJ8_9ACTN|nr:alpha/beta hydrolase [Actinorhabdospora filicis]GLZ78564.1 epoxide hydrolase [Actinorhabdospora filicis]
MGEWGVAERVDVAGGQVLGVRRVGVGGGVPLVLLHGFPVGAGVWARCAAGLARAGFEVVAPDLRGYGESRPAAGGFYDVAAMSGDVAGLCDGLGWRRVVVAAFGLGARVAVDLANRHGARVDRLVLMNHWPGGDGGEPEVFGEMGRHSAALLHRLGDGAGRVGFVSGFLGGERGWCPEGAFGPEDVEGFCGEYADADRLAGLFGAFQAASGARESSGPGVGERVVRQPVFVMAGDADGSLAPDFAERCGTAYPEVVGPFLVPGAGHFLPWERPVVVERAIASFCADLRG